MQMEDSLAGYRSGIGLQIKAFRFDVRLLDRTCNDLGDFRHMRPRGAGHIQNAIRMLLWHDEHVAWTALPLGHESDNRVVSIDDLTRLDPAFCNFAEHAWLLIFCRRDYSG